MDVMEGLDCHLARQQKTVTARKEEEEKRKEKEKARASQSTEAASREAAAVLDKMEDKSGDCTAVQADVTDDVTTDPDTSISSWQEYKLKKKPDIVTLNLPQKGLAKLLTPIAGRMHMSTNQSFAYAAEVIKAGKGKVSDFAISRSTFYAQSKDAEEEIATKLTEAFKNDSNVRYIIIHWDGKKVKLLDRSVEEHIALLLQAVMSGRPPQFIGAPCVPDGTGLAMKDAMMQYLNIYDLTGENKCKLIGMGFDTTASNMGHNNGAASLLENELDRALLWFACRHHVAELHMGWADDAVRHAIGKCHHGHTSILYYRLNLYCKV